MTKSVYEYCQEKRLEEGGWKIGRTAEFLNLSAEEAVYIELKIALSKELQYLRKSKKLTTGRSCETPKIQSIKTCQDGPTDTSVTMDLLFLSLPCLPLEHPRETWLVY